ncbi:MAG: hypothetical protein M0022_07480 [Desulfobacteraceae bacterium]|nr:hypothetical protein [Desulfobacteraceae bacterium]
MARKVTISDILGDPTLNGETVTVQGRYMGWSSCGSNTTMLTRSDWVLRDETGCIFVTGGTPPGIRPYSKPEIQAQPVTITARVEWIGGKVILRFIKGE